MMMEKVKWNFFQKKEEEEGKNGQSHSSVWTIVKCTEKIYNDTRLIRRERKKFQQWQQNQRHDFIKIVVEIKCPSGRVRFEKEEEREGERCAMTWIIHNNETISC